MRSIRRMVLVGCVAVCAVSAVGVASASAHEYFVRGEKLTGTEKFEVEQRSNQVMGWSSLHGTVTCTKVSGTGSIENTEGIGKSSLVLKYVGCSMEPVSCKIAEPIEFKLKGELTGELAAENLFSEDGAPIATLVVHGCSFEGTYKLKGTQLCGLPNGATEAVAQSITCETSGSKLYTGSLAFQYRGNLDLKLASGKEWSIK